MPNSTHTADTASPAQIANLNKGATEQATRTTFVSFLLPKEKASGPAKGIAYLAFTDIELLHLKTLFNMQGENNARFAEQVQMLLQLFAYCIPQEVADIAMQSFAAMQQEQKEVLLSVEKINSSKTATKEEREDAAELLALPNRILAYKGTRK